MVEPTEREKNKHFADALRIIAEQKEYIDELEAENAALRRQSTEDLNQALKADRFEAENRTLRGRIASIRKDCDMSVQFGRAVTAENKRLEQARYVGD